MSENDGRASITEHLIELRTRLVRSIFFVFLGFGACYGFSEKIFDYVRQPIMPFMKEGGLYYTGVMEKFLALLKVSFLAGVLVSSPFWFWQVWRFIAPGLYAKEKKYAVGFLIAALIFFFTGAGFSYFFAMPFAFKFLFAAGSSADLPLITIDSYLDFLIKMILAFGGAFEMPVILVFLGMMGVVDHKMLSNNRRYAVISIAVVSAVITPPDAISMLALLVPLWILFELSVVLVRFLGTPRVP